MAKSKQIAALLKTDLGMSSDLASIAKMLEKKGRGNDTILAHITKKEADILKDMGGAGTINPDTGLLEFYDGEFEPYLTAGAGPEGVTTAPVASNQIEGQPIGPVEPVAGYGQAPEGGGYVPREYDFGAPVAPEVGQAIAGTYQPQFSAADRGAVVPSAPGVTTPAGSADLYGAAGSVSPPQEKSFLEKLTKGLSTQDMVKLGLTGAGSLLGAQKARVGARQAQAAQQEQAALGKPYQQQGQAMIGAAMRGELTPTGQQSLQALQARLAQGVEARGGVGAAQSAAQIEAYRQQLLQGQYDYGLKVSSIGDQIALGAIRTGMQANQQLQQASTNFYTQLAAITGGTPMAATDKRA